MLLESCTGMHIYGTRSSEPQLQACHLYHTMAHHGMIPAGMPSVMYDTTSILYVVHVAIAMAGIHDGANFAQCKH